jgi:transposase
VNHLRPDHARVIGGAQLLEKKPFRVVSVALANKLAKIAWVVLTKKETFRPYSPVA